jgi:hypothetical protein
MKERANQKSEGNDSHGDERLHLDPNDFDKVSGFDSVPA